ncbi:MAG: SseB family protein [Lachnospiraceae bacterium]|nr:SseB family protein [Lachnospiraceae bacterium]
MPVETKVPGAYPEGKKAEDPQTGDEKIISEVRNLKEAYILYSPLTNMPYVECEEENYNDQIRLYQKKTEAEEAGKELEEKGIRTAVRELKTVEVQVPVNPDRPDGEKKRLYLNQVRQQLSTLPFMGVNAVCYKPERRKAQSLELAGLLPEDYEKKINGNGMYQPNLQLTGLYLMQEARRKKEYVDMKNLQALDEEFSSNLVRAKLFLAVLPPAGQEKEQKIDLKKCQLPYLKHQNGDTFFPVFTDLWEFQKYVQGKKNLRPIQVPFPEIGKFWVKDAKAYMVNPMGFSLPVTREMIPRILEKFGVGEKPDQTSKEE